MQYPPEVWDNLLDLIREGLSVTDACRKMHVSVRGFYKRCQEHPEYKQRADEADVDCKLFHIRKVRENGKFWQASAWMLERKWGREFGRQNYENLPGDLGNKLEAIADAIVRADTDTEAVSD